MKILVSDSIEQPCMDILRSEGYEVDYRPGIPAAELSGIIGLYDALVVRSSTTVDAPLIALGTRLKVIGRAGTGVDNIDVDAATRKGILVMNTPGGNTISAAEHAVSMMLALARNIPQAHASLLRGEWNRKKFVGVEVVEKTVGIIGLGKIGREVALRCQGLGMRVIGYDPLLQPDVALKLQIELVGLEDLYRRSDFITVHTPLTEETRHLLNDGAFSRCKQGVRVVNCARGGVIDEQALLRALQSGRVAGAALDVFEHEPPGAIPLLAHDHVIATPHLGASTGEAQEKVAGQIAHQIVDALQGRSFSGVVNASAMQWTIQEEVRPYLVLAEKLGSLAAQYCPGKVRDLTVSVEGELVNSAFEVLKAGVLKGILSRTLTDVVNVINAPFLAEEMGLSVQEQRVPEGRGFTNSISLQYETEKESFEASGTVFGKSSIRLVKLEGFHVEVRPEGDLLVYRNIDRPGVLAKVGGVLAENGVNIGGVSLGRTGAGAEALTVMNIDSSLSPRALGQLRGMDGVTRVRLLRL